MKIPEKRRIEIRNLIQQEKSVSVEKIAKLFDISPITVRRDLEKLHERGLISKVHGGAIYKDALASEPVFMNRINLFKEEKNRIALEAAKRINDGDSIIIESGRTCQSLVKYLVNKNSLKIATAGFSIAIELLNLLNMGKDFEISICGGILRAGSSIYVGPHAVNFFNSINVDKSFIGAVAISIKKGLSTATQFDAELSRAIVDSGREIILLTDSSKFGTESYINFMPLTDIDEIITDNNLDKEYAAKIKELGIKLTLV
ncbi:MAG: DeoR/GlpR family DNA-binding transcription regulator [Actinomycetota bacterium]|nr:DeoR/GlpR family DNA-binding transcription regulator [Actinomycetota bacterium]